MKPRTKRRLISLGLFLFFFGLFAPFKFTVDRVFWEAVLDAGHYPAFAVATIFLLGQPILLGRNTVTRCIAIVAGMVLFAGLTELIQGCIGRSATWSDFVHGSLGCISGAAAYYLWRERRPAKAMAALGVVCMFIAGMLLAPALTKWRALRHRDALFPVLAGFENDLEMELWRAYCGEDGEQAKAKIRDSIAASGEKSLEVTTCGGSYSGARYRSVEMSWKDYERLKLKIYNPGAPFRLAMRIDDENLSAEYEDRFNRNFEIGAGWNELTVLIADIIAAPKGRPLNVQSISQLLLFVKAPEPLQFFIDDVRLER